MRAPFDPYGAASPAIDQQLGDAFQVVRFVARHIPEIASVAYHMEALYTLASAGGKANADLLGLPNDAVNLGEFEGDLIPDNTTVRSALQVISTYVENLKSRVDTQLLDMGQFTGTTIPDQVSLHDALQALETAIERVFAEAPVLSSEEQAEEGTDNTTVMSPLRVAQAITSQTAEQFSDLDDALALRPTTDALAAETGAAGIGTTLGESVEAVLTTLMNEGKTVFDIRAYGAIPGGEEDCSEAIRAAMNAARDAGGGVVYVPTGVWRKADTTPPIHMYDNTTLMGDGIASVILNDDLPTNPRNDMIYVDHATNVAFRNFKILGTARTYPTEVNFCQTIAGQYVTNLVISGVTIEACRQMATAFEVVDNVLFTGCHIVDSIRDGARFVQARNVRIIGNHFQRVADDCIAVHSRDDYPDTVVPHNVTIIGNTIETCQGIKLLGVKNSIISNNTFRWCMQNPIYIWNHIELPEGNTAIFSSLISDNVFLDTMSLFDTDFVICADFRDRSKGALSAQPGAVAPVFPYTQIANTNVEGAVNMGGFALKIVNNIIGWAAPRVAKFSDYGCGDILNRNNAYGDAGIIDPEMNDAAYTCKGVVVLGPVRSLDISGNSFHGGPTAINKPMIYCGAPSIASNTIVASNVNIKDNTFSDCPSNSCVSLEYTTTNGAQYINIVGNTFDLDPFFRNQYHNVDNTWANDDAAMAISLNAYSAAGVMSQNHFKNCSRLWALGGEPLSVSEDNVAYFDWQSGGVFDGSAGNLGIRNVPFAPRVTCIMIDGVPTNDTFGRLISIPSKTASSMPTTGKYVRGHFVRNINPVLSGSVGSQYYVSGWSRMTNGSDHVLNTDWLECRNLTGT